MSGNTIMKVVQKISKHKDLEYVFKSVYGVLCEVERIYSVIVYYEEEDSCYTIQYNISQNDDYNTLEAHTVTSKIADIILNADNTKRVCGYMQPPIDVCLEVYDPFVLHLARKARNKWKYLEEDDYAQICRMVMIKLYQKGYYLHKRLIEKAFNNELLMSFRNRRNEPLMVSFEDTFYAPITSSSEELKFADIIEDTSQREAEEERYIEEAEHAIFEEVKDIIIDLIGVRQWNELMRDYGNKHTTAWSRKKMTEIKRYFEKMGLTRKEFNKKYYE